MGGGNRLGLHVQFGLPLPSSGGGKGEGEGRGEGKGGAPPPLVQFGLPMGGGAATACGLPPLSPLAHVGPLLSPGGSGNLPVLRKIPETIRNHSGVRILLSNISIFTSQPFRDSSPCP